MRRPRNYQLGFIRLHLPASLPAALPPSGSLRKDNAAIFYSSTTYIYNYIVHNKFISINISAPEKEISHLLVS